MIEMFSLRGKVAVVTGASRGIGRLVGKGIAAAGAHVVLVARDSSKLEQARAEIEAAGGSATVLALDLADDEAIRAGIRHVVDRLGRVDICANVAGIIGWEPVLESTQADFDRVMDTNLRGTWQFSQECAGAMRAAGRGGRIIMTASLLGPLGRARLHAYCGSKAAIIGLAHSMAAKLGPDNITVNCVAPGLFPTDINASLQTQPAYVESINRVTPMQRWGKPEEIVGAMIFLASDASSFITGQVLHVDGGLHSSVRFQLGA